MAISGKVIWKDGVSFEAEIRKHKILIDSPNGQTDKGPSPKELALIGIAGCSGMDVASILTKKRLDLKKCDVSISTDLTEGYPSIFKNITLKYEVAGGCNLSSDDVLKAVSLSMTKYCGVSAMFAPICDISYDIYLNDKFIGKGVPNFKQEEA